MVLKDSRTSGSTAIGLSTGVEKYCSTFTAGSDYTMTKMEVVLYRSSVPSGNISLKIYSPNASKLPNTLLATSTNTIDASTLTTTPTYYTFNFSGLALTNGTQYVFSIEPTNKNYIITYVALSISGQTTGYWTGSAWTVDNTARQMDFKTYDDPNGTKFQINIGDSWKTVAAMQINIGDSWKPVASAQINIGDAWKTI